MTLSLAGERGEMRDDRWEDDCGAGTVASTEVMPSRANLSGWTSQDGELETGESEEGWRQEKQNRQLVVGLSLEQEGYRR